MKKLLAAALCAALTTTAWAQGYVATDLGTLGGATSYAWGINASGQVTGYTTTAKNPFTHAFITGANGLGLSDLGPFELTPPYHSEGIAINDLGQVLAIAYTADYRDNLTSLTSLSGGSPTYFDLSGLGAAALNNVGQVGGYTLVDGVGQRAFVTGPNGVGITYFGTLGGVYSTVSDINNFGRFVGSSAQSNGVDHAFISDGTGIIDLGSLGTYSSARAINDLGQVTGTSLTASGYHAFITGPDGIGMTDIGTMPGFVSYFPVDINNSGVVVGNAATADGIVRPFIADPNGQGMVNLDTMVNFGGVMPRVWDVQGINDYGQIAANINGRAFVLTPVPEPSTYALMLAGLAALGLVKRRARGGRRIGSGCRLVRDNCGT